MNHTAAILLLMTVLVTSQSALGQKATEADRRHCSDALTNENTLASFQSELSSAEWTDLELCRISSTLSLIDTAIKVHTGGNLNFSQDNKTVNFWKEIQKQGTSLWFDVRNSFCEFHPSAQYVDVFGNLEHCPGTPETASPIHTDRTTLDKLLTGNQTFSNNVEVFWTSETAAVLDNTKRKGSLPPSQSTTVPVVAANTEQQAETHSPDPRIESLEAGKTTTQCEKNISFAVADGGSVHARVPAFAQKWISKNEKKYSGLCFSQTPNPKAANYLLVFSTSQSAFNGIFPTVRTSTNTTTTPTSGSGTVTDNYGGVWNYTYDGTVTTTTTTTMHDNLPYTDTSNTLYLHSYDEHGRQISERWRTVTTRQGGDGTNTLGYNLGAALGAIHVKQHLLKNVVEDVTKGAK